MWVGDSPTWTACSANASWYRLDLTICMVPRGFPRGRGIVCLLQPRCPPSDDLARRYARRSEMFAAEPRDGEWLRVEAMQEK
jgi:hypothetical protein